MVYTVTIVGKWLKKVQKLCLTETLTGLSPTN